MAIHDFICRHALEFNLDTTEPPATNHDINLHRQLPPNAVQRAVAVQTEIASQTRAKRNRPGLVDFPIEVLSRILEEAAESAMLELDEGEAYLAVDCLRPEKMIQSTVKAYPKFIQRFNSVSKSLALVCRLFHGLIIPLIWRSPFFSPRSTKIRTFVQLLRHTTAIAPSTRLPAPQPFWTYVRVLTPWTSSIFYTRPDHLIRILPALQALETINFGSMSGEIPIDFWEQICAQAPVSLRRLPDLHLNPNEEDSGRRMSCLFGLLSRCRALETFDLVWGSSLRSQIDHFRFALALSRFQPEGTRIGSALRTLEFNALCDVPLQFLQGLPALAPLLDSLHFEVGSRIIGERPEQELNLSSLLDQLVHLQTFSFTPTLVGVRKTGSFKEISQKLPRLTGLQVFVSDVDALKTFSGPGPVPRLACLCLCATNDMDLTRLVCIRRPWRIRRVAQIVVELVELLGGVVPRDEESVLDLFRKASSLVEGDVPRIVFDWR